jgi:uroporphyrin-III C-methyltransferase
MINKIPPQLRIGICGSASVGKTSLANALASDLGLPCLREEMRDYLEGTGINLVELPPSEVAATLLQLWEERKQKESQTPAFIADNCSLDFAAYALYYGCLNEANSTIFLSKTLEFVAKYDAIFVLPWGVLPYTPDGIRPASQHLQLRYQLILEGLLRKYVDPKKLHFFPEKITHLDDRCRWVRSLIMPQKPLQQRTADTKETRSKGFVYLVGAGPGDPKLLTVRATELLKYADVVAYDLLISPETLAMVPKNIELIPVGRRYGAGKIDYRLHPDVLARAQAGQTVVRLKCGDPLLFGRGGEEAEELTEAGIPFEIVPGVSAAFGAAAYSGIPLTHRGLASEVLFSTGHDTADSAHATNASIRPPHPDHRTTVLYMAARRLQANVNRLIRDGYAPDTPAALVASATTPYQQVIAGTLATLPQLVKSIDPDIPALLIAGRVVSLHNKINWLGNKSLRGSQILIARARPGTSRIAKHLRNLGASVLEAPAISAVPLRDYSALHAVLENLQRFDAVLFGCADGVRFTQQHTGIPQGLPAIAIGDQASQALHEAGVVPSLAISGHCHDALQNHFTTFERKHLLLITSDEGRPNLYKELSAIAASVEPVVAYQLLHDFASLTTAHTAPDLIVLPSSSAATRLLTSEWGAKFKHFPIVAMGPATEAAAKQRGADRIMRAPHDDIESIVSSVLQYLTDAQMVTDEAKQEERLALAGVK